MEIANGNNAIIIVDAWENLWEHDQKQYPEHAAETKAFGSFLNLMAKKEHNLGNTIYHSSSYYEIMHEFDRNYIVECHDLHEIPKTHDHYIVCGFHLGRCITRETAKLMQHIPKNRVHIAFDLSLKYPADDWGGTISQDYHDFFYVLWTNPGFQKTMVCIPH